MQNARSRNNQEISNNSIESRILDKMAYNSFSFLYRHMLYFTSRTGILE
jgi:hypothetical protein